MQRSGTRQAQARKKATEESKLITGKKMNEIICGADTHENVIYGQKST